MKKNIVATAVVIGFAYLSSASMAGTYLGQAVLSWSPGSYSSGYGGEFNTTLYYSTTSPISVAAQANTVYIPSQNNSAPTALDGYTLIMSNPAVFETFCIQAGANDVTFNPGSYYAGVVENSAYNANNPQGTQTVTVLTQTLYAMFSDGTLASEGYDYNLSGNRSTSAGELQSAIWVNQGDYTNDTAGITAALAEAGITADGTSISQVETYLAITPGATSDANYQSVQIMGLYDNPDDAIAGSSNGIAQAQLVEITGIPAADLASVPLPLASEQILFVLAGMGLGRMVYRSRKIAQ
ncbi:MAG TPA: hypothetical protein VGG19_12300 [Tepidisphaeraceae bacterium]|jgi:hypothetical protein